MGDTATWAARVTAAGWASHLGSGSCSASGRATTMMPAEAATESWNPATPTSIGSMSTREVTARPRMRNPLAGRPSDQAVTPSKAMAVARSTDGSNRVRAAKTTSTATVASHRVRGPNRRSSGPTAATTKATFSPDTTSRWLSPEPRKSSATTGDWPRTSPSTKPP